MRKTKKKKKVKGNARLLYLTEKGSFEQSNLLEKCGVQSESRHRPFFGYCGYCTTGSNFIRSNRATICFPNVNRRSVATYGCVLSINNRLCASLQ